MSAALVDRSDRLRMTVSGAKAKEALGGLVTNDVVALKAGHGQRAAALTPKGRVIALVRVFDRGDDLLVDCERESSEGFTSMIRKFVNPRLATCRVVSEETGCLGVYDLGTSGSARDSSRGSRDTAAADATGTDAAARLASAFGVDRTALEAVSPLGVTRLAGDLDIVRSTDLGVTGFDVIGAREAIDALRLSLEGAGVPRATADQLEVARVEAGLPRFGVDMDGETIPQEANLDALGAVSFNKGCYTGQEVVARIHFRGHVNRHLRWLTAAEPLPSGAAVLDGSGKEVGTVRSSVMSPARGPLAMAMIHRKVEPGSEVRVAVDGREVTASVQAIA